MFRTDNIMSMHLQSIVTKRCCCNSWIIDAEKERKLFILSDSQERKLYESRCNLKNDYVWKSYIHMFYITWKWISSVSRGGRQLNSYNIDVKHLMDMKKSDKICHQKSLTLKHAQKHVSGTHCNFQLFVSVFVWWLVVLIEWNE